MRITADTNVLVRAITGDDPHQSEVAQTELANAELVALTLPTLCELAWVLSRSYRIPPQGIVDTFKRLICSDNVSVDRPAVEAGLTVLEAGGDFADGVIAYEGERLGADTYVSFDRKAVDLVRGRQRRDARLLA